MNYYPHHIGDYLRDTAHLSLSEHGAYRRMLDLYYASEKPLPLDVTWVCRLIRADSETERESVQFILSHFFEKCEDGWRNKRADSEIKANTRRAKAARTNGKKGGRPITQQKPTGLAEITQAETQAKAPKTKTKTKTKDIDFSLPAWVPEEAWDHWLEVRSKVKAPNTQRALSLALNDLQRLRDEGQDPKEVLELATARGWKGLFPAKKNATQPVGEVI